MSAKFSASGRRFDVDSFLAETGFEPESVWHRGELVNSQKPRGERLSTSGFMITVGKRDFAKLAIQVRRSIRFFESPQAQQMLTALSRWPEAKAELDFGIAWLPVIAQFDYLPPRLVKSAGRFGIGLIVSHYPVEPGAVPTRVRRRKASTPADSKKDPRRRTRP